MSDIAWNLFSKGVFGGSILLIIYIIYREYTLNRIKAENDELALGEKENADLVNSQSDTDLINSINKEFGSTSNPPPTKPASPLPGSPSSIGNSKKPSN